MASSGARERERKLPFLPSKSLTISSYRPSSLGGEGGTHTRAKPEEIVLKVKRTTNCHFRSGLSVGVLYCSFDILCAVRWLCVCMCVCLPHDHWSVVPSTSAGGPQTDRWPLCTPDRIMQRYAIVMQKAHRVHSMTIDGPPFALPAFWAAKKAMASPNG